MCGPRLSEKRVAARQQARREVERDAVELVAQQASEPDVHAAT